MFFYRIFSLFWLQSVTSYWWAFWRRFAWRDPVFVKAARKDTEVMVPAPDAQEHPPFLKAALNYFQLQLVQAADWFRERYHPLDTKRRDLQKRLEEVLPEHAVAGQERITRTAELKASKDLYVDEFQHEPTFRPWWVFVLCFIGVILLAAMDAPIVYKALTAIAEAAWMLVLMTAIVLTSLVVSGHITGMKWHSHRKVAVGSAALGLSVVVVIAFIRQGTLSSRVAELFPHLPTQIFPILFVSLSSIVFVAATLVSHYLHQPQRMDFDRKTREFLKAAHRYSRLDDAKNRLQRALEAMEPLFINLDQQTLAYVDVIVSGARRKFFIYVREVQRSRTDLKGALPLCLNNPFEFTEPELIQEIRERERQRRENAKKKAATAGPTPVLKGARDAA